MPSVEAVARAIRRFRRQEGHAAFGFILLSIFLDVLALGVVIPVLAPLVQSFQRGDAAAAAGVLALFGSTFAAMTFLGSPFLGVLSDSVGRRPVLLIGLLALGFDYMAMGFAPNLTWLFAGRIVAGLAGATGVVAGAYIADTTSDEDRARAYAWAGAIWGLGFIAGPALGGWLGRYGVRAPFWCAAGLTILGAIYGAVVLPEPLARERRAAFRLSRANPLGSLTLLRERPELAKLAVLSFLRWLAHGAVATLFVLYAANRYGLGPAYAGSALAIYGVFDILVQALVVTRVIAALGERAAMLAGLAFGCVAFVIFGLAPNGWLFGLGLPFLALIDLFGPGFMAIATRGVGSSEQGRLQGAVFGVQTAAQVIGPALFGATYASLEAGPHSRMPGVSFLIAAGVFALALGLAPRLTRKRDA
jgi:MFS transporter, DHA1 family, tetracycline resistance protein